MFWIGLYEGIKKVYGGAVPSPLVRTWQGVKNRVFPGLSEKTTFWTVFQSFFCTKIEVSQGKKRMARWPFLVKHVFLSEIGCEKTRRKTV